MPGNFQHVPGVAYIAGVTFQSEYGVHEAGTVVKEAEKFPNLQVLVDNRFLWPYAPDEGYEWLPPHLFNDVHTMEEAKAYLEGDPAGKAGVEQWPDGKPQQVEQAEAEAEAQDVIREQIKATQQPGVERPEGPTAQEVADEAVGPKVTARTTKKTASRKETS